MISAARYRSGNLPGHPTYLQKFSEMTDRHHLPPSRPRKKLLSCHAAARTPGAKNADRCRANNHQRLRVHRRRRSGRLHCSVMAGGRGRRSPCLWPGRVEPVLVTSVRVAHSAQVGGGLKWARWGGEGCPRMEREMDVEGAPVLFPF